ncbi:MAG: hypothetical protein IKF52_00740 [Clostridia bacterium]|nr:hypothetical protein [Clostridia bacterium]
MQQSNNVSRCKQCQARHLALGTISQLYQRCAVCSYGQEAHKLDHDKWNGYTPSSHK